jgi:hypothetical protein
MKKTRVFRIADRNTGNLRVILYKEALRMIAGPMPSEEARQWMADQAIGLVDCAESVSRNRRSWGVGRFEELLVRGMVSAAQGRRGRANRLFKRCMPFADRFHTPEGRDRWGDDSFVFQGRLPTRTELQGYLVP